MASPSMLRGLYRRSLQADGELVTIRRPAVPGRSPAYDATGVLARITGYGAVEAPDPVVEGIRWALLLAEDVEKAVVDGTQEPWPGPLSIDDMVIIRGRPTRVLEVDDSTRRVGSVLLAYNLRVKGL